MITLVATRRAGPVQMDLALGNGLPETISQGSGLCTLGWEEGSARLGHLCTGAGGRRVSQGPVSSSHLSKIFSIGVMVRCGSIKFIQNLWRVYSENSDMI